jgi:hypothetical protein
MLEKKYRQNLPVFFIMMDYVGSLYLHDKESLEIYLLTKIVAPELYLFLSAQKITV